MKDATKQIEWLEAMRELNKAKKVEKLKLISLKIDPVLLRAFKLKCGMDKRPYTKVIKELMEDFLNSAE